MQQGDGHNAQPQSTAVAALVRRMRWKQALELTRAPQTQCAGEAAAFVGGGGARRPCSRCSKGVAAMRKRYCCCIGAVWLLVHARKQA
jgi:hypothetical protein